MNCRKILSVICSGFLIISMTACSTKPETNKQLLLGNAMSLISVPRAFTISEVKKQTFSYDEIAVSSYKYTGSSEDFTLTATTFPFSAKEYQEHFKSPYTDFKLDIKTVYQNLTIKNPYISECFFSEAYDKDTKEYHNVYILSFPEKIGCLVFYVVSEKNDIYSEYLENFTPVKKFTPIIDKKNVSYSLQKRISLNPQISIEIPEPEYSYTVSNTDAEKLYVYALSDGSFIFIKFSEDNMLTNSKNVWNYTNGFEKYSDNYAYNINTNTLYCSSIDNRIISTEDKMYVLSVECFVRNNHTNLATEIAESVKQK